MALAFASGTVPLASDTIATLEAKILLAIGGGSSGGGGTGSSGVADPEGSVTAATGSTYWATGSQTFWVKQTGSGNTGWVQLI